MRTTLTLESDVAAALERFRDREGHTLKDAVNRALRRGLRDLEAESEPRSTYRTVAVDLGRCLVGSVDDVAEVLAIAEGEDYR